MSDPTYGRTASEENGELTALRREVRDLRAALARLQCVHWRDLERNIGGTPCVGVEKCTHDRRETYCMPVCKSVGRWAK